MKRSAPSASDPGYNLAQMGLVLPRPPAAIANFLPAVVEGGLVYVSGQGPIEADGTRHTGKVGADVTTDAAYAHARLATLNILAVLEESLGSLSRIRRIVKVFGMVNSTPGFRDHPRVINGCSDLLVAIFGQAAGRHARSAVGMGSLPGQITVEIELVAALHE